MNVVVCNVRKFKAIYTCTNGTTACFAEANFENKPIVAILGNVNFDDL